MRRYWGALLALGIFATLFLVGAGLFLDWAQTTGNKPELVTPYAEGGTAIATVFLGFVTVFAVIMPLVQREDERRRNAMASLAQLYHILSFFVDRTSYLNSLPHADAQSLLYGLDPALIRALSDDIGAALPPDLAHAIYRALFDAHGAIARAIDQQRRASAGGAAWDGDEGVETSIRIDTGVALQSLCQTRDALGALINRPPLMKPLTATWAATNQEPSAERTNKDGDRK
jgi:hypothetical protein